MIDTPITVINRYCALHCCNYAGEFVKDGVQGILVRGRDTSVHFIPEGDLRDGLGSIFPGDGPLRESQEQRP